jgi:hypothetical protein
MSKRWSLSHDVDWNHDLCRVDVVSLRQPSGDRAYGSAYVSAEAIENRQLLAFAIRSARRAYRDFIDSERQNPIRE